MDVKMARKCDDDFHSWFGRAARRLDRSNGFAGLVVLVLNTCTAVPIETAHHARNIADSIYFASSPFSRGYHPVSLARSSNTSLEIQWVKVKERREYQDMTDEPSEHVGNNLLEMLGVGMQKGRRK